jgi:hypothetical protein
MEMKTMRMRHLGTCLLLAFVVGLSAVDAAQNKNPAPKGNAQPPVDADKLPPGKFIGTLLSTPDSERMFTLKVTYKDVQFNPNGAKGVRINHNGLQQAMRNMQHAQQQMARAQGHHHAIHNMMQMQQAFMQMQQQQAHYMQQQQAAMVRLQQAELRAMQQQMQAIQRMYKVVDATKNVDFQSEEAVKVRTMVLPEQFDDKGNIKKYTAAELRQMKGKDVNLPGYESSVEALKPGQVVQVYLGYHRKAAPAKLTTAADNKDAPKDAEKPAPKDPVADPTTEHKMQVKIIVILQDSDGTANYSPGKKK